MYVRVRLVKEETVTVAQMRMWEVPHVFKTVITPTTLFALIVVQRNARKIGTIVALAA